MITYDDAVKDYESLVRHLAQRVCASYELPDGYAEDIIQEGFIALMGAVDRFDEGRGFMFMTFCYPTIHGIMRRKAKRMKRVYQRETAIVGRDGMTGEEVIDESCRCELTAIIREEDWLTLKRVVLELGEMDRLVIQGAIEGKSNSEMADEMGVTKQRVSFVRRRAMRRVQEAMSYSDASSINRQTASAEV